MFQIELDFLYFLDSNFIISLVLFQNWICYVYVLLFLRILIVYTLILGLTIYLYIWIELNKFLLNLLYLFQLFKRNFALIIKIYGLLIFTGLYVSNCWSYRWLFRCVIFYISFIIRRQIENWIFKMYFDMSVSFKWFLRMSIFLLIKPWCFQYWARIYFFSS